VSESEEIGGHGRRCLGIPEVWMVDDRWKGVVVVVDEGPGRYPFARRRHREL
jgi:Uma2 family endonuclease